LACLYKRTRQTLVAALRLVLLLVFISFSFSSRVEQSFFFTMRSFFLCTILLAASVAAIFNDEAASNTEEQRLIRLAKNSDKAVGNLRDKDYHWTGENEGEGNVRPANKGEDHKGLSTFTSVDAGVLVFHLN
jgi:hypothetical protein